MMSLAQYLTSEGVTQQELARRLGVTQATVSRLVRGATPPSLDLAYRIQRLTGGSVPMESWFPDDPAPRSYVDTPAAPDQKDVA